LIAANEIAFQYTEADLLDIDVVWQCFLLEHCSLRFEAVQVAICR